MKKLKFILLLLAVNACFSCLSAQTADEIISKHVDAIGGAENWKKINSIVQTGTMASFGNEIKMVKTAVHNKASRQDFIVSGINGYRIITPTEGWSFFPFQGQSAPEAMTADDLKESQDGLDIQGHFIDYKAKGHSIELLGKEEVEGTACYKLKLNLKGGRSQTYFFDVTSFYIVKMVTLQTANGQEIEAVNVYSNYKKLPEGVVIAMNITIPLGQNGNAEYTVTNFEINTQISEAVFKPAN